MKYFLLVALLIGLALPIWAETPKKQSDCSSGFILVPISSMPEPDRSQIIKADILYAHPDRKFICLQKSAADKLKSKPKMHTALKPTPSRYRNLGCASSDNCLTVDTQSIRKYPSGKIAVDAGVVDPATGQGARVDTLVDCYNGTMLNWDETIAHPPRSGTLRESLFNFVCKQR